MLKIWGRPYSSNVIPVLWTANELGLDYELQLAGGSFGKLDSDAYARINPNRMIPAIEDDGFALWESNSIIRYLSSRYGAGTLYPDDLQTRAIANQWMDWCSTLAFGPVIYLFFATVRTKPTDRDPAKIADLRDQAHLLGDLSQDVPRRQAHAGNDPRLRRLSQGPPASQRVYPGIHPQVLVQAQGT